MLKNQDAVTAFREYYLQYCGYVEIFKPSPFNSSLDNIDNIWGVNFRIPFKCKLLTNESASALIVQVSHASHQEQLTDFMNQVEPLSKEMDHQLSIYHSEVLKFMTNHWGLYKDLSLYLVMLINLYVLIAFDKVRNFDPLDPCEVAVVLVGGIIQALLYFLGLAFHIVQRYPLILHAYSTPEAEEMEMDQLYGLPDHDSQKYKHFEEPSSQATRTPNGCLAILCYLPTFTGLLYMTASILAIMYPLLSPVLLLTIIERKVEVQNVLKAVTQNKKQLALSGLLGVIIMYVFAVFAFLYFANFYENGENISCSTVLECLLTTINMGLRGGLADAMGNPDSKDVYWMRYTFDILFHLIIIILLMSVLFGIIIDTFGKLRDERSELYDKINNSCYVCDQSRNRIELGGKGWSYHFQVEHSPFAYLAYLVRLKEVPEAERNGIESYVYKLSTETDSSFFPSTSRHLIQALN
jgi:inositol 1,4,5-triphosphate receptor type 3